MADKVSEMTDQEIKELMRAIAKANGRPLSEERLEADLPAYKNYLAAIERFTAHSFAMEDEPASSFSLRRFAPVGKDTSR